MTYFYNTNSFLLLVAMPLLLVGSIQFCPSLSLSTLYPGLMLVSGILAVTPMLCCVAWRCVAG